MGFFHAAMMPNQGSGRALRTALCITGLVTLIAFYHYFRIFDGWVDAYKFPSYDETTYQGASYTPIATGKPFNDAYRYMDWLLTVPLLLIELILVMDLDQATTTKVSTQLGLAAGLMIILGYPGEISESHGTRWFYWFVAMIPFCFIVYTLFVGLKDAVAKQPADARDLVSNARYVTIISWLTYPIVYILPMLGANGTSALVGIQIGYSVSDFISKCVVGLMITKIALKKSRGSVGDSGEQLLK